MSHPSRPTTTTTKTTTRTPKISPQSRRRGCALAAMIAVPFLAQTVLAQDGGSDVAPVIIPIQDFALRMWFGETGTDRYTCTDNSAEATRRSMKACLERFSSDLCGWSIPTSVSVGNATCDKTDVDYSGGYLTFDGNNGGTVPTTPEDTMSCVKEVVESPNCVEYMQVVYYPYLASNTYRSETDNTTATTTPAPSSISSQAPTPTPSGSPVVLPTPVPTTTAPVIATSIPTTVSPTAEPTLEPTAETTAPTNAPVAVDPPTRRPRKPTSKPSRAAAITNAPVYKDPLYPPTEAPTVAVLAPTDAPTAAPTPELRLSSSAAPTAATNTTSNNGGAVSGVASAPLKPGANQNEASSGRNILPIAIGAAAAGVVLIALLVGLDRKRRRHNSKSNNDDGNGDFDDDDEDDDSDWRSDPSPAATTTSAGSTAVSYWGWRKAKKPRPSPPALSPTATLALSDDELLGEYHSDLEFDVSPVMVASGGAAATTRTKTLPDGADATVPDDVESVSLHSYDDTEGAAAASASSSRRMEPPGKDLRLMAMVEVDTESVIEGESKATANENEIAHDDETVKARSFGASPPVDASPTADEASSAAGATATCLDAADCSSFWTRRNLLLVPRPFAALYGSAQPSEDPQHPPPKSDYDPDPTWNPDDTSVRTSEAGDPFGDDMQLVAISAARDGEDGEFDSTEGLSMMAVAPPPSVIEADATPPTTPQKRGGFFARRRGPAAPLSSLSS